MRSCHIERRRSVDLLRAFAASAAVLSYLAALPSWRAAATETIAYDKRIGWFHGLCLAISDPNLTPGTAVTLVVMGDPQRVERTEIRDRTTASESCPALSSGRADTNVKSGAAFYRLSARKISNTDTGIGLIAPPEDPTVTEGLAHVDLNGDGGREVFASCATSEGIKFSIWKGKAYQGTPVWSAYYYLGYDLVPSCP